MKSTEKHLTDLDLRDRFAHFDNIVVYLQKICQLRLLGVLGMHLEAFSEIGTLVPNNVAEAAEAATNILLPKK